MKEYKSHYLKLQKDIKKKFNLIKPSDGSKKKKTKMSCET